VQSPVTCVCVMSTFALTQAIDIMWHKAVDFTGKEIATTRYTDWLAAFVHDISHVTLYIAMSVSICVFVFLACIYL